MAAKRQPELGWTTPAKVVRVIDGDTIVVEIRRVLNIRIRDCWAPESRTRNLYEKVKGLASKLRLLKRLHKSQEVRITIPTYHDGKVQDFITLGRLLGDVYLDGVDIGASQVRARKATAKKKSYRSPRPGESLALKAKIKRLQNRIKNLEVEHAAAEAD